MRKPKLSTCYHESGHAVAANIVEFPIEFVFVRKHAYNGIPGIVHRGEMDSYKKTLMYRIPLFTLAGPAAQARFESTSVLELYKDYPLEMLDLKKIRRSNETNQ